MKNLIAALVILLGYATGVFGATHTVTTCSQSNVQTAVNNAVPGDSIYLNCSSATWATSVTVNKGVHIYGNGDTSTTITANGAGIFVINGAGGSYRISNMAFRGTTGSDIKVNGYWTTMRFDNINWQTGSSRAFWIGEMITADVLYNGYSRPHEKILIHNITYAPAASGAGRPFALIHGRGHLAWQESDGFGTDNFVFIEDSTFDYTSRPGGYITDTERGGRFVLRYNTILNAGVYMHDLGSTPYARGNRAVEVYENIMTCNVGASACSSIYGFNAVRGGTGVFYNNTLTGYSTYTWPMIFRVAYDTSFVGGGYCQNTGTRKVCQDVAKHCSGGPRDKRPCWDSSTCPGGTCGGYTCSVNSDCKNAQGVDGLCMQIDGLGRTGSEVAGWPCRDQMGRGQDNASTGTQASSPVYWWNNTVNGDSNKSLSVGGQYADYIKVNRDYCNHSPATDCGSKAAWTYTPYTYPHPWRTGEIIEDTTDPVILTATPTGNTACDAESPVDKILTLTTSDSGGVECGYCVAGTGCDEDTNYSQMTRFAATGGSTHTQTLTGLACSTEHNYYVICRDTSPNQNEMDDAQLVTFTIGAPGGADPDAPSMTNPAPSSGYYQCGDNVELSVTVTDDNTPITCKYNATDVAYASMTGTFTAPTATVVKATDSSYAYSNYTDVNVYIGASHGQVLGQSFQSGGGTLDSARFYLSKTGTPTGDIRVALYAHSGTLGTSSIGTGDPLAVSETVNITTGVSTSVAPVTFTFTDTNRYTLVDGTNYVIAVEYSAGDRLNVARDATGNHQGNTTWSTVSGSGGTWTAISGSDLIFDVYTMVQGSSTPVVIPNITIPLTVNANNRRYFNDGSGRAVMLSGMENFFLITPYKTSDCLEDTPACGTQAYFEDYVDTYTALGHNFTRLWTGQGSLSWNTYPWNRTGPGNALDGSLKFDMTSFNEDYFDDVKAKVAYALANNMYVSIMLLGSNVAIRPTNDNWDNYAWYEDNNINAALASAFDSTPASWYTTDEDALDIVKLTIKKFIDELNEYPNVIWEIANEPYLSTSSPNTIAWLTELVDYVKTYEATLPYQHLVWVGGNGFTGEPALNEYLDDTGVDIVSPAASGSGTWITSPYSAFQGEPNILATDHLWGYSAAEYEAAIENWIWKAFTRGYNVHFLDCNSGGCGIGWTDTEGRVGQIVTYADKMDLVNMTPSETFSETDYALVHSAGLEFVVFQPGTGAFDVDLTDYPNDYSVEWLEVDDGTVSSGSDVTGGGVVEMTPPDTGEFVLYLKIKGIGGAGVHTATLTSPACGQSHTYYSRCIDGLSNANSSSQTHTFTIYSPPSSGNVEFESGTIVSPMVAVADAEASGSYYVNTTQELAGSVTHSVTVATAGTYRITARVNAADTGSDSVFLTIDEGTPVLIGLNSTMSADNWNIWREEVLHNYSDRWAEYHVTLTADTHSFVWEGREIGAKLDWFRLDPVEAPLPPHIGTTRFMIGTGQTMVISPTTGGCTVIIE